MPKKPCSYEVLLIQYTTVLRMESQKPITWRYRRVKLDCHALIASTLINWVVGLTYVLFFGAIV